MVKNNEYVNKRNVKLIKVLNKTRVLVECPLCGSVLEMWKGHFYRGSNSCKCNKSKSSRLYSIYTNIKTRCYNSNSPSYLYYGAKGIKLCKEWMVYKSFEKWAFENGYDDSLSIDRIDSNKDYSPSNCHWVDSYVQNNNKSSNVKFTVLNECLTLSQICKKYNLNYKTEHDYKSKHLVIEVERRLNQKAEWYLEKLIEKEIKENEKSESKN